MARLRGSNWRKDKRRKSSIIEFQDDEVDIQQDLPDVQQDVQQDLPEIQEDLPDIQEDLPEIQEDIDQEQVQEVEDIHHEQVQQEQVHQVQPFHQHQYQYDFEDVPISKLYSSITSVTTIHVLQSIFVNLFENNLIPQAMTAFNDTDPEDGRVSQLKRVSHKLDMRIFQMLSDNLTIDLNDILDINKANNELCYQLKELNAETQLLNKQLVKVRREHVSVRYGGDKHRLEYNKKKIDSKIDLNDKLMHLTDFLLDDEEHEEAVQPLDTVDFTRICNLLDPNNGIIARLKRTVANIDSTK